MVKQISKDKEASPLTLLIQKHFPDQYFLMSDRKAAGKILKHGDEAKVVEFLTGKGSLTPLPDFRPPAKAAVVARSRPFEEWPIYKACVAIQTHVLGLRGDITGPSGKRPVMSPGLTQAEFDAAFAAPLISSASHKRWLTARGLDTFGFTNVQGLNKIFGATQNRYNGVIKKVDNRNEKNLAKIRAKNARLVEQGESEEAFEPEHAFDGNGHLLQPPGLNHSIYCYANVSPRPCTDLTGFPGVDPAYTVTDPTIILPRFVDRLLIPKGHPGYVPEHHRAELNPRKNRLRAWYSESKHKPKPNRTSEGDAFARHAARCAAHLLVQIRIGEDWVLLDARGLLRDARRRGLAKKDASLEQVLKLFTGDPVIDVKQNVVVFVYRENIVQVRSETTVPSKRSKECLLRETCDNRPIALVSVDLGQTNPLAARITRVTQVAGELLPDSASSATFFLPKDLDVVRAARNTKLKRPAYDELEQIRHSHDVLEDRLRTLATGMLTSDQQQEMYLAATDSPTNVQVRICDDLGLDPKTLPWAEMSSFSTHIADAFLKQGGDPSRVRFEYVEQWGKRKGKIKQGVRRDIALSRRALYRLRVSAETRKAYFDALCEAKRVSTEYAKLSKRKQQFVRQGVNWLQREAARLIPPARVIFNIENLNVRFFHGAGKRESGWSNFFTPKKENRWFIQAFHRAFTELAAHRGVLVIESTPQYTSQTCIICSYCHPGNRNGEDFRCLQCGADFNADKDVATWNLQRVALTGQALPKPPKPSCEQSGGTKKPAGARKRTSRPETAAGAIGSAENLRPAPDLPVYRQEALASQTPAL
jgi:hypothetical protein